MAQTKAQLGIRTLFQIMYGSPAEYTTVPEVRTGEGFGVDRPEEEVTHMLSPNDSIERIAGLKDGMLFTLSGNLTVDNREMIESIVNDGAVVECRQIIPPPLNQTRYFNATPVGYTEGTYAPGSPIPFQLRMRINRAPSPNAPAEESPA